MGIPLLKDIYFLFQRRKTGKVLTKCFEAPYKWGYDWIERGYCDAFNIGQNVGEAAGQTVMFPRSLNQTQWRHG